jgi:hypothetical protein
VRYVVDSFEMFHLGHEAKLARQENPKISPGEWKRLQRRVTDIGRKINAEDRRAITKGLAETGAVVEQDRRRAKAELDAAEFAAEIAQAIANMVEEHFSRRKPRSPDAETPLSYNP